MAADNPATTDVTVTNGKGLWSVTVPGVALGDAVRIELRESGDGADPSVRVELVTPLLVIPVALKVSELRALLAVVNGWPGVVRGVDPERAMLAALAWRGR